MVFYKMSPESLDLLVGFLHHLSIAARRSPTPPPVRVLSALPESEPNVASRSVGAFFEPEAVDLAVGTMDSRWRIDRVTPSEMLGKDQSELAGIDLPSLVHPYDVDRLLSCLQDAASSRQGAVGRVRLRHATLGWAETRCLFFPLADQSSCMAFVLAQTAIDSPPASDAQRIATLERHLLRFAAELHAGGWRDTHPFAVDASHIAALDELPRRQRDIVDRLLRGERVPYIATSLYIAASTVRNHLSKVYATFGVHTQSELVSHLRSGSDAAQSAEPKLDGGRPDPAGKRNANQSTSLRRPQRSSAAPTGEQSAH